MLNRSPILAILALCLQASASNAAPPRSFEAGLRRSISVQDEKRSTFTLLERMDHYRVPGVSVAVIDRCRIVDARGFGRSAGNGRSVTAHTLFQAGSISKSVTAVAAMRLVEQGKLALDDDIRPSLRSWSFPVNALTSQSPVTLRRLLNHTAGLNEVGGKGYLRGAKLPTIAQTLEGAPPANTPPIRVEKVPGTDWAYSSGGYHVAQALMIDATGEPFSRLAERLVLEPAGMKESSFAQPLDPVRSRLAADAVGADGTPLLGGWLVNPELAAGGLWSTPTDLARFLIALTRSLRGENDRLLGARSAHQIMARGLHDWGLGVQLGPLGGPRQFRHTGHNVGFVSEYVMYPDTCQGAVVMTNADEGGWLVAEVLRAIGDAYGWQGRRQAPVRAAVPITDAIARRFIGTYRLRDFPSERFAISRKPSGGLYWARIGHIGRDLLPENAGRLFSPDSEMTLQASDPAGIQAATLELSFGGGKNIADRIE